MKSATSDEEARLIQRAKAGDPDAFAEIYDRYQPAIYRYIFYRIGDESTAEDLTSEVFVRLVERIDRFTYRGRPLLAWLYTIARNLVTDHYRQSGSPQLLPLEEGLVADSGDPEEAADRALVQRRLARAIARLTEDQRRVILLRFVEGMDTRSVAQVLGKPVGAVKALQHRALAAMRRILEKEGR
ncbi:MAG TPA: sigma-70 family RNA polymerase sigma factor [Thermoflexia bacterium]|jgi:RNA polymerase sigma-70 factor (ECF subfamily)|nr:sigma-70 family RNA polymerase sigma factor [Thermoflexia bacterium]